MNKKIAWTFVILVGMLIWSYKGFQTLNAYEVAKAELENRSEITDSLGTYKIEYDWWFGVYRVLIQGEVQEFEFHLIGDKAKAISVVEVTKIDGWKVSCVIVVNGEYLNKRILYECEGV